MYKQISKKEVNKKRHFILLKITITWYLYKICATATQPVYDPEQYKKHCLSKFKNTTDFEINKRNSPDK